MAVQASIDPVEVRQEIRDLVGQISYGALDGTLCSVSCAVYDTAWVAMVGRNTLDGHEWTFPECFEFLLENQLAEGGWQSYASAGDGVLNSLAALLALKRHEKLMASDEELEDLRERCSRAKTYIERLLRTWDVHSETRVGFEYLVPNLLELLKDDGISFSFPCETDLYLIRDEKMEKFKPEFLYGQAPSTVLHALEAFGTKVDFDRLDHHKMFGSMMASPSSSAAFLMYSSAWHDDTEAYLRRVISSGTGNGSGAVPSVYPIPIFELVWVSYIYGPS